MDYDEKYFKISANKKALRMWVIIGLALTGAYIAECVKGARTVPYTVLPARKYFQAGRRWSHPLMCMYHHRSV